MEEHEVYAVIGHQGFERLTAAFYRQVPDEEVLGPLYRGRDLAAAEERLRGFLIYRFGGPQQYIEQRGHPRLRMRHAPFAIDERAREHWMKLMSIALADCQLDPEAAEVLLRFFESTASFLINRPSV